jgi:hypothetical protein
MRTARHGFVIAFVLVAAAAASCAAPRVNPTMIGGNAWPGA